MENSIILAIGKGIKAAVVTKASGELEAGVYPIDTTIHIKGQIKKGEDYDQVVAQKAEPWRLFAIAMSKLNEVTANAVTVESIVALTEQEASDEEIKSETEIKKSVKEKLAEIKKGALTLCKGNVTTKVEFAEVVAVSEKEEVEVEEDYAEVIGDIVKVAE